MDTVNLLRMEEMVAWKNVLELARTDPIVAAVLTSFRHVSREQQLVCMVLALSADRTMLVEAETERLRREFPQPCIVVKRRDG